MTAGVLRRLAREAGPYRGWMLASALLGFLTVGSGIGLMIASGWLIATSALRPSIAVVQVAVVGVRFFGLARGVCRYLERLAAHETTFRLLARFRVWFYRALLALGPARLATFRSGDLLSRLVADVESLDNLYARLLGPPAVALLVSLLMAVLLGVRDPRLAAAMLAGYYAAAVAVPLAARRAGRADAHRLVALRAAMRTVAVDATQGLADLLAFGAFDAWAERWRGLEADLTSAQRRLGRVAAAQAAATGLIAAGTVTAVLLVALPRVESGAWSGVALATLALGVFAAFEAVAPVQAAVPHLDETREAGRRVLEVLDAPADAGAPTAANRPGAAPRDASIRFEAVRFAYGPGLPPALDGVTFDVPAGGRVALAGATGAGKSTVWRLLVRFHAPQAGRILLGGASVASVPADTLHAWVGVVPQRPRLLSGTLADVLRLGAPDAGEERMRDALEHAGLGEWFARQPARWRTEIGEAGLRLSGGERRRLAVAQALLRPTPVLVLDEPTADLDPLAEARLLDLLWDLGGARTVVLVTHRLARLERADRVLVLDRGRLAEAGPAAELAARDGVFRRLLARERAWIG